MTNDIPDGDFQFIALDVETACGNSASICQIGIACVGYDESIQTWSTYVDPQMPFALFNIDLHGIGPDTVQDAQNFAQVWPGLVPLLSRHPMVQHSRFDEHAINAACKVHGLPPPRLSWHNSVSIARAAWPELKGNGGLGLANLKQALNLDFHHHDAGEDARAAAMVVLRAQAVASGSAVTELLRFKPVQLSWPF